MNLRFRGSFDDLKFNKGGYTSALHKVLEEEVEEAMRHFLRAALLKVPVYQGYAQGALMPIARFLNMSFTINPVASFRLKGSSSPEEIGASKTSFDIVWRGDKIQAEIEIGLLHYRINEFHNVQAEYGIPLTHPTPWHSFEAGREAFRAYLRANLLKRLPRIKSHITRTRVTI